MPHEPDDLTESVRLILVGLNKLVETLGLQTRMLDQAALDRSRILQILTDKPTGPSPIAEALAALVGVARDNQAGIEHIEASQAETAKLIGEIASALLTPRN